MTADKEEIEGCITILTAGFLRAEHFSVFSSLRNPTEREAAAARRLNYHVIEVDNKRFRVRNGPNSLSIKFHREF